MFCDKPDFEYRGAYLDITRGKVPKLETLKAFIDKIAYAVAMMIVSSVLAIGAASGETVGMLGIKLTGIFACVFSLISVVFFMIYNDKDVTKTIEEHNRAKEDN